MAEERNLNAIVEIYTTGVLHKAFDDPDAETLCDYEHILLPVKE